MDISVLFSWKTTFQPVGWTAGNCVHCQGTEAVRVDEKIWVFAIYFVPIVKIPRGVVGQCDFCGRAVTTVVPRRIEPDEWVHAEGLRVLLRKLAVPEKVAIKRAPGDERLTSLLSSTQDAVTANNLDVTLGITTGLILGLLAGIPIGTLLYDAEVLQLGRDRFGSAAMCCLLGGLFGAIIGGAMHLLLARTRRAKHLIHTACRNYKLNQARLVELSSGYSGPVHRAACDLRDGA